MDTRQITEALFNYQAAERAYYNEAFFPLFGVDIARSIHWNERVATLRSTVLKRRADYFAALRAGSYECREVIAADSSGTSVRGLPGRPQVVGPRSSLRAANPRSTQDGAAATGMDPVEVVHGFGVALVGPERHADRGSKAS